MEIIWTYNFLETVGFLILFFFAAILVVRGILILYLWLKFKGVL